MSQMDSIPCSITPSSPGQILHRHLIEEMRLSQTQIARSLGISKPRFNMMLKGRCKVTPEIALRLERVFGVQAKYWLRVRDDFELFEERQRLESLLKQLTQISAPMQH